MSTLGLEPVTSDLQPEVGCFVSTLRLEPVTSNLQPEAGGLVFPSAQLVWGQSAGAPLAPGGLFLQAGAGGFTARSVP